MLKSLTFNILSQRYLEPRDFFLEWSWRRGRILEMLNEFDCDIICLQDVELKDIKEDWSSLKSYIHHSHSSNNSKRKNPVGNITFWKHNLFILIHAEETVYAIYILLNHLKSSNYILICNLQLVGDSLKHKTSQLKTILRKVVDIREKYSINSIYICGDFKFDLLENDIVLLSSPRISKDSNTTMMDELSALNKSLNHWTSYSNLRYRSDNWILSNQPFENDIIFDQLFLETSEPCEVARFPNYVHPSNNLPIVFYIETKTKKIKLK